MFDQNNNFDGTSTFTAPVTGLYQFNMRVLLQSTIIANAISFILVVSGTSALSYTWGNSAGQAAAGNSPVSFSTLVKMTAGDTAIVYVNAGGGTKTVGVYGAGGDPRTSFSGFLVC